MNGKKLKHHFESPLHSTQMQMRRFLTNHFEAITIYIYLNKKKSLFLIELQFYRDAPAHNNHLVEIIFNSMLAM